MVTAIVPSTATATEISTLTNCFGSRTEPDTATAIGTEIFAEADTTAR